MVWSVAFSQGKHNSSTGEKLNTKKWIRRDTADNMWPSLRLWVRQTKPMTQESEDENLRHREICSSCSVSWQTALWGGPKAIMRPYEKVNRPSWLRMKGVQKEAPQKLNNEWKGQCQGSKPWKKRAMDSSLQQRHPDETWLLWEPEISAKLIATRGGIRSN